VTPGDRRLGLGDEAMQCDTLAPGKRHFLVAEP